jgi:N-acetylglutamate synthase-like GNAT family acetyltransferase
VNERIAEQLDDLRRRQEQLRVAASQQIVALTDHGAISPGAVTAEVDDHGLLSGLSIDQTVRRRISPADLAEAIDREVQRVQQPTTAVLRAVGLEATSRTAAGDIARIEQVAAVLGRTMASITDDAPRPDPHVVAGTGTRATATYGVIRSVVCDPAWLARSTDVAVGEEVVAVCRRAALDSDTDLRQDEA